MRNRQMLNLWWRSNKYWWWVISKRQEIDITAPELKTTEYQQIEKICPKCKARNKGEFPENIRAPVQRGNNTRASSIYLHINHKVPFKRTTEIIADLLNLNISKGSIENFLEKAFKETNNIYPEIMNKLKSSEDTCIQERSLQA